MWASGDYTVVCHHLQMVSEVLCEAVDVHARTAVLDIACENGNTALAAARQGCRIMGIDQTPSLLDQGRQRAADNPLTSLHTRGMGARQTASRQTGNEVE